ncbi:MAG: ATP-binding protein [Deltaproteobacteria bacterium]|nr:ATP-binding protein [Deltaproteobacteria bacterium]
MERYLKSFIIEDLKEKMVFVGGPRQVGKTTLALSLLKAADERDPAYFNYDDQKSRAAILEGRFPAHAPIVVLDELHKFKNWRNLLKGFYDTSRSYRKFLVTGSARLDFYRRGGDSLQGRYHYYRLHPLHLDEVSDMARLLVFGGFPEPYFKGNSRHWNRWQNERRVRVLQEDLISLEQVREVSQVDLLASVLSDRVGSLLSVKNLAKDLGVAFETADRWIEILENLYYCFRIQPYGTKELQTTKKERKLYMWDWSLCQTAGARFENFLASYLLKYCHFRQDYYGDNLQLGFLRDREQREIDFVIIKNRKIIAGIECKTNSTAISPNIKYFAKKTKIPQFFQFHQGSEDAEIMEYRTRCVPFAQVPMIFPCGMI